MPLISHSPERINKWIQSRNGGYAAPGCFTSLGWEEDGELLGGITWGTYNGAHCTCTIALAPGHNPIHFLTQGLNYSFSQLALRRLTFIVDEGNISSINLCTKLGAILEATLRAASPDGDLLIFALFPENCKLWKRFDEKRRRTPAKS